MSNYIADSSGGRTVLTTTERDVEANYNVIEGNENGMEVVQHAVEQTIWIKIPQANDVAVLIPASNSPYPSTTE